VPGTIRSAFCIAFAIVLASCGPSFHPTVQDIERDVVGKTVEQESVRTWTFDAKDKCTIKIVDIQRDGA
jgi:hypothetical protein